MRKNNNNKRRNRRISLTIDEIREIVRLELEAAKHNARGKDIERVWIELRKHERLPDGWLSRPQQKREVPKFTLISVDDRELRNLRHFKDTSVGLWCIDRNPNEVSMEWIRKHAFRLEFSESDKPL